MFSLLRKFLVIFLLVLQFFAPLVHAHVGEKISVFSNQTVTAIHLPGLEFYDTDHHRLAFEAIRNSSHYDGVIIGVDAGIKDVSDSNVATDESYFMPQQTIAFKTTPALFDSNFSPQTEQFICRLLFHTISPRAPPAL
jgi:hypothetical protein